MRSAAVARAPGRAALAALPLLLAAASGHATDFAPGDLFVAMYDGTYLHLGSDGVLLETIATGYPSIATGCTLDPDLDLYATLYSENRVVEVSPRHPHAVLADFKTDGAAGPADTGNEAVRFESCGGLLVGHALGSASSRELHRYQAGGVLVEEFPVARESAGSDWFDLASDGCTLFYTS